MNLSFFFSVSTRINRRRINQIILLMTSGKKRKKCIYNNQCKLMSVSLLPGAVYSFTRVPTITSAVIIIIIYIFFEYLFFFAIWFVPFRGRRMRFVYETRQNNNKGLPIKLRQIIPDNNIILQSIYVRKYYNLGSGNFR